MVDIIVAKEKIKSDHLLGSFLDESHFDRIIDSDTDCYGIAPCDLSDKISCNIECSECDAGKNEDTVLFKFRKNFFSKEEQLGAYYGLGPAATQSQNRGLAAGPKSEKCSNRDWVFEKEYEILDVFLSGTEVLPGMIDPIDDIEEKYKNGYKDESSRGNVWLSNKVKEHNFNFDEWVKETRKLSAEDRKKAAEFVSNTLISKTTYANSVFSGIAGSFDRYPRIPYLRHTSYTKTNYDVYKKSFPFLQKLSKGFEELLPRRFNYQKSFCDKIDSEYVVPGTVFTTLTVNKTFRTAAHLDAGDLGNGFSNLSVVTNGIADYTGGLLVLPEYRIAINIRPGDLLLIANHTAIHGNTPIHVEEGGERISIVAYFREGMIEGGCKEYEDLRFEFIEERRLNKEHNLWRPLWNGISPGWDSSEEWYEYLLSKGKESYLQKYHPEYYKSRDSGSLEEFFN